MRPSRPDHRFPDGPLQPAPHYLEKQREMLNMELAMMPREAVGSEDWARKVQEVAKLDAILAQRR